VIRVDVALVPLSVSVVDKEGNSVEGLTQANFQVLEDDVVQEISLFRHEDSPVSLGLVVDSSGSMRNKKERVHSAALAFVKESNPDDETFLVAFSDEAFLQQDFTGSMGDLVDALDGLDPRLETAMYDAIYLSPHLDDAATFDRHVGGSCRRPRPVDDRPALDQQINHAGILPHQDR
jgi:VWFA-related protein